MKIKERIIIRIFITLLLIFSGITGFSQNWPKIYGDYIDALGEDLRENYDLGYLICGSIMKDASHFKYGWLIKTDINGYVLWDKKFGEGSRENFFLDFDMTQNNGLIISGGTAKEDIERDPIFIKLDPCGEIEWCKIFLSPHDNTATGIVSLPNGEYLGMVQYYGGDAQNIRISLVKMDTSGEPIWIKNLAQEDSTIVNEDGFHLYLTLDGNYLVSGSCFNPSLKPFLIETDTSGEQLWDIKWPVGYGGWADQSVFASNGMIYNATGLQFSGQPRIPYMLKFNENGDIINQYPLLGDTIVRGGAESLLLVNDTTMYVGLTWSDDPTYEETHSDILKTDTLGNMSIQRRLKENSFPPQSFIRTIDSKIVTMGYYYVDGYFDIYMWKMNADLEDDTLYTQPITYDSLCPYQILSDTVDLDCGLFVNIDEIPTKDEYESTIKISPNPAWVWISLMFPDNVASGVVELNIYNIFGQEVLKKEVIPANRMIALNISSLSSGLYFVVSKDDRNNILKGKFIKARD
jgi:hypothetical protein